MVHGTKHNNHKIKIEVLRASPSQPSPLTEDLNYPNLAWLNLTYLRMEVVTCCPNPCEGPYPNPCRGKVVRVIATDKILADFARILSLLKGANSSKDESPQGFEKIMTSSRTFGLD